MGEHIIRHTIDGVEFAWSLSEEPGDCMNQASVTLEDACCHKVEGTLQICSRETLEEEPQWEARLTIDGRPIDPPLKFDSRFGIDLRKIVHEAMTKAVPKFKSALRDKQEATRELLYKVERQKGRALDVRAALEAYQKEN